MLKQVQVMLILAAALTLASCSSHSAKQLLGSAAGNAAGTEVAYDKQCTVLKNRCVQGVYDEWQTSDGLPGCSCKKL